MKRSSMTDGYGTPLDRVLAGANRHDSPLLAATLDTIGELGPLPGDIRVHLDAGYDSQATRDELAARKMARSRGSGASAGSRCGTTRRAMNRRFVRRVTPVRPGE